MHPPGFPPPRFAVERDARPFLAGGGGDLGSESLSEDCDERWEVTECAAGGTGCRLVEATPPALRTEGGAEDQIFSEDIFSSMSNASCTEGSM